MGKRDPIPTKDSLLLPWATNYVGKIVATPAAYGTTVAEATQLQTLLSDYTTRLSTADHPDTRTRVAIRNKNVAKAALVAQCRKVARIINADPDTTDGQREELGLNVRDRIPTVVGQPVTHPIVSVEKIGSMEASVRISDVLTPSSRAKPFGVHGAYIFIKIGDTIPASLDECKFVGTAKRNRHVIPFPAGSVGKTFWVVAQWVNDRAQTGPISIPVPGTIAV